MRVQCFSTRVSHHMVPLESPADKNHSWWKANGSSRCSLVGAAATSYFLRWYLCLGHQWDLLQWCWHWSGSQSAGTISSSHYGSRCFAFQHIQHHREAKSWDIGIKTPITLNLFRNNCIFLESALPHWVVVLQDWMLVLVFRTLFKGI